MKLGIGRRDPIPWLAVGLALLAYLPFLLSTRFLYPLGTHEWDFISQWPDLGYWETQVYWYRAHTGRYSSTALLTTLPYWYNLTAFRLLALIDLLSGAVIYLLFIIKLLDTIV